MATARSLSTSDDGSQRILSDRHKPRHVVARRSERMRLLTAAIFALASGCGDAKAGQGPCGLELGLWASSKSACQYADNRGEATERFGRNVFLELEAKAYQAAEARCSIRSAKLSKKSCKLNVTCTSEKGKRESSEVEFYLRKPDQIMINLTNLYEHCGASGSRQ